MILYFYADFYWRTKLDSLPLKNQSLSFAQYYGKEWVWLYGMGPAVEENSIPY